MINKNYDRYFIYAASLLRTLGLGMMAVLLAIYLTQMQLSKAQIGIVISLGLAGAGVGTLLVTFFGNRMSKKTLLVGYAVINGLAGAVLCLSTSDYAIGAIAFLGMLNARGRDRGPAVVLEASIVPSIETAHSRTKAFATFCLLQDVGRALGGIIAGAPTFLASFFHLEPMKALQSSFLIYSGLMFLSAFVYLKLSKKVEIDIARVNLKCSPSTKKVLKKLCSFFALDSLAGGFLSSAVISYYFYERFGLSFEALGFVFFAARMINICSYIASVWLSKKIGLINTMVFTHLSSHLLLIAMAFVPSFPIALALFFMREMLSEMDDPARQSYVMAIVKPEERTMVAGTTLIVKIASAAVAPAIAWYLMQSCSNALPLFIGAGLKVIYDLMIFFSFSQLKPPEEEAIAAASKESECA